MKNSKSLLTVYFLRTYIRFIFSSNFSLQLLNSFIICFYKCQNHIKWIFNQVILLQSCLTDKFVFTYIYTLNHSNVFYCISTSELVKQESEFYPSPFYSILRRLSAEFNCPIAWVISTAGVFQASMRVLKNP